MNPDGENNAGKPIEIDLNTNIPAHTSKFSFSRTPPTQAIPHAQPTTKNITHDLVYTVNLQLPQFNSQSPDLWFAIAEADFNANRITNDLQKYVQLLKALPFQVAEQLQDIVSNPPTQDKYITLKNAILKRFSISRKKQLKKLLSEKVGGDKKPSQMLREMRTLAMNSVTDEVLHQLWIERLPTKIHPLLIISECLGLDALAEMADRFVDSLDTLPIMAVHSQEVSNNTRRSNSPTPTTQLEQQLSDISITLRNIQKQLYDVQTQQQHQQTTINQLQQNTQQERRPRSRQRSLTPGRNGICYYYEKWGKDARRCTKPCNFLTPTKTNQAN